MPSMLIAVLLLTSCISNTYASNVPNNNYKIKGDECGPSAHEIGGIVTLLKTADDQSGANRKHTTFGSGPFYTTQEDFSDSCKIAKDSTEDNTGIDPVFLKEVPEGHGSQMKDLEDRICCMRNLLCGHSSQPELLVDGLRIRTCDPTKDPETQCNKKKGYLCTGNIAERNKKVCCEDMTPTVCPSGLPAEQVCSHGNDSHCNGEVFFEKGHSCLKIKEKPMDLHSYCCGVKEADKCPGKFDAFANKDNTDLADDCELNKEGYIYGIYGRNRCCPRMMSQIWDEVEVVYDPRGKEDYVPRQCETNEQCTDIDENTYCDSVEHRKLRNVKSDVKFCFQDPVYIGKAVKNLEGFGLKECRNDTQCSVDEGEICSASMGKGFQPVDRYVKSRSASTTNITHVCFKLDKCKKESGSNEKWYFLMKGSAEGNGYPKITTSEHRDSENVSYSTINATNHLGEVYPNVTLSCAWQMKRAADMCLTANTSLTHPIMVPPSTMVVVCESDSDCSKVEYNDIEYIPHCIKTNKKDKYGVCCEAAKCPFTNLEIRLENDCTGQGEEECGAFNFGDHRKATGECSTDPVTKKKHCCPIIRDGVPRYPYTTKIPCKQVADCVVNPIFQGIKSLYCDTTDTCAYVGLDSALKSFKSPCTSTPDCWVEDDKYQGICAQTKDGVFCHENPEFILRGVKRVVKNKWVKYCVGFVCGAIVFAIMSLIFFLKYRSRHLCDKFRKADKKKKGEKSEDDDQTEASQKSQMSQVGAPK